MREPIDPDEVAKLIKASGVANLVRLEYYQGAYYEGGSFSLDTTSGRVEIRRGCYYEGAYLRIETGGSAHAPPQQPMKVKVDPPKTPAKKPKKLSLKSGSTKRAPSRIKAGTVFLKNGTILLKDREADPERPSTEGNGSADGPAHRSP